MRMGKTKIIDRTKIFAKATSTKRQLLKKANNSTVRKLTTEDNTRTSSNKIQNDSLGDSVYIICHQKNAKHNTEMQSDTYYNGQNLQP